MNSNRLSWKRVVLLPVSFFTTFDSIVISYYRNNLTYHHRVTILKPLKADFAIYNKKKKKIRRSYQEWIMRFYILHHRLREDYQSVIYHNCNGLNWFISYNLLSITLVYEFKVANLFITFSNLYDIRNLRHL